MTIWLIGGTSESRELAIALICHQTPFIVTATTENARQLYAEIDRLQDLPNFEDIQERPNNSRSNSIGSIRIGKLSQSELDQFAKAAQISAILDASHPFATEISQMAIAYSQTQQIPYLRFERADLADDDQSNIDIDNHNTDIDPSDQPPTELAELPIDKQQTAVDKDLVNCSNLGSLEIRAQRPRSIDGNLNDRSLDPLIDPQIVNIPSLDHLFTPAIATEYLVNKNVLLTLGCKSLVRFKDWRDRANLFARILPQAQSIAMAEEAGFSAKQLIAIRPPISAALEKALWQQWQIQTVITKASGLAGGEDIKRTIAAQLKVPLIIIARAKVNYPAQTNDLDDAIDFCNSGRSAKFVV